MNKSISIALSSEIVLAEHAAVIRALGKRVVADIIEIGRRLTDAKRIAGHGNWLPWLEREFGWTEMTAQRFMQVHDNLALKSNKLLDLELPISGLYLLAAPSTPDEAREAVIQRVEAGEAMSVADVKTAVDKAVAEELGHKIAVAVKAVREQYAGKLVLEPDELHGAIEKAVKPLQDKLDQANRALQSAEQALERNREKKTADNVVTLPEKPAVKNSVSLASTGVALALKSLTEKITVITPAEMVDAEVTIAAQVHQKPINRLGPAYEHAKIAKQWLDQFIETTWKALQ